MRIVSLLPSASELICGIGLQDHLVGVSHECDYPAKILRLPRVTRPLIPATASSGEIDRVVRDRLSEHQALYSLDVASLRALQPDLIVTQALCDVCAVADSEVRAAVRDLDVKPQIVNLEPACLEDIFTCLHELGSMTDSDGPKSTSSSSGGAFKPYDDVRKA